ncbi:hypothetical protein LV78_006660 [Actinosynnema pretiosum]|nr:hypothetical protein [Actinosynnema pretiosum]
MIRFTSEQPLDGGLLERAFTLDGVPGLLWTSATAPGTAPATTPPILLGHPGGLDGMRPRLLERARQCVASGFAAATLELPGAGDRPRLPGVDLARADLRRALEAGEAVGGDVVDRLVLPLVELAVPEWRGLVDGLLALPGVGGPVGYSGG